jgi:hypothetical protein
MKPLVFDLFCGLGGWSESFIAEGYRAVGFDIEAHDYGSGGYPGELVLRDIRSLTGGELVKIYGVPAVIVSSPPCHEFSYMAMPWTKAKEKMRKILADKSEQVRLTDLFNQCFRIQREVSEAAGHYVPMIVENVRGAQRWVGRSKWNFGSFHLWGDVPALMPIPAKVKLKTTGPLSPAQTANHNCHINEMRNAGIKAGDRNKGAANGEHKWTNSFSDTLKSEGRKTPEGSWDPTRKNYNPDHSWEGNKLGSCPGKVWAERPASVAAHRELTRGEGNKTAGMNWSDRTKRGQDFTRIARKQAAEGVKQPSVEGQRTDIGNGARFTSRDCGNEGSKGFTPNGEPLEKNTLGRAYGSKSPKRKQTSAEIAKIPPVLARWIAKVFKPKPDAL